MTYYTGFGPRPLGPIEGFERIVQPDEDSERDRKIRHLMETNRTRRACCYHEAAHILVSRHFGATPLRARAGLGLQQEVTEVFGPEYAADDHVVQGLARWRKNGVTTEQRVVIALAGAAGERLVSGRGEPAQQDHDAAVAVARQLGGDVGERLRDGAVTAERLVAAHSREIAILAEALFAANSAGVNGDAIEALLDGDRKAYNEKVLAVMQRRAELTGDEIARDEKIRAVMERRASC